MFIIANAIDLFRELTSLSSQFISWLSPEIGLDAPITVNYLSIIKLLIDV